MGRAVWPADDRGAVLRHSRRGHAAWRPAGDRHTSGGRAARHARRADPRRRQDQHARPASLPRAGRATVHSPRDGGELRTDLPDRPEDGRAPVDRTLVRVLAVAAALRLLAAVFSGGFLASDDHHVVIGAADQIATGVGLPVTFERSALYPGVIAAIMAFARQVGIDDPGTQMFLVRLVQAF